MRALWGSGLWRLFKELNRLGVQKRFRKKPDDLSTCYQGGHYGWKGKKVLIIDDDADFVASTGKVLKSAGYQVIEAVQRSGGASKIASPISRSLYIIDMIDGDLQRGDQM